MEGHRLTQDVAYGDLSKEDPPLITPDYERQADSVIEMQLEKAGVRLASVFRSGSPVSRDRLDTLSRGAGPSREDRPWQAAYQRSRETSHVGFLRCRPPGTDRFGKPYPVTRGLCQLGAILQPGDYSSGIVGSDTPPKGQLHT